MSRTGNSIEKEKLFSGCQDMERKNGSDDLTGMKFLRGDEDVWELDNGDGCTTLQICLSH